MKMSRLWNEIVVTTTHSLQSLHLIIKSLIIEGLMSKQESVSWEKPTVP